MVLAFSTPPGRIPRTPHPDLECMGKNFPLDKKLCFCLRRQIVPAGFPHRLSEEDRKNTPFGSPGCLIVPGSSSYPSKKKVPAREMEGQKMEWTP